MGLSRFGETHFAYEAEVLTSGNEDDVDPVVGGMPALVGEGGGRSVGKDPVSAAQAGSRRVQGRAVQVSGKEVLVVGIVAGGGVIGGDVESIRGDGYWTRERDLLPSGGGFVGERGRCQESAG